MRSVVAVLPASICAAIPMLRVRSIGYRRFGEFGDFLAAGLVCSNTASISKSCFLLSENENAPGQLTAIGAHSETILLPAEMCKCLVGLRHFMDLVTFANRVSLSLVSIHDFRGQGLLHRNPLAGFREIYQPAQSQGT